MGLLGTGVGGLRLLGPAEAGLAAAEAFVTVWVLLEPGFRTGAEASLDGEVRFSGTFVSAAGW